MTPRTARIKAARSRNCFPHSFDKKERLDMTAFFDSARRIELKSNNAITKRHGTIWNRFIEEACLTHARKKNQVIFASLRQNSGKDDEKDRKWCTQMELN